MKKITNYLLVCLSVTFVFAACKKKKNDPAPGFNYTVPETYNFDNVNYDVPTGLISKQEELEAEMAKGKTQGTQVSAATLHSIYTDTLKSFTETYAADLADQYLDSVAIASQSSVAAANGVSGVAVSSTDPAKKYLLLSNGKEPAQIVSKLLIGTLWYYQLKKELSNEGVGYAVDNVVITPGIGTKMQHNWDEAFGYFGAPKDFPANKNGIKYLASYSDEVDPALNTNSNIMNAFLKGRAAMNNSDYSSKDLKRTFITDELEKGLAAFAIHELNDAKRSLTDNALKNHYLSEAYGFVISLKYVNAKRISQSQVDAALASLGNNFYQTNK